MTQVQLIDSVNPQSLTVTLQNAGYRVTQAEQNGLVQLLSASQGMGYSVRFGSPAMEKGAYMDFTFSSVLRVQGGAAARVGRTLEYIASFCTLGSTG
jgi:hypothetical protein